MITAEQVHAEVNKFVTDNFGYGSYTERVISDRLAELTNILIAKAAVDIDALAVEIVGADALENNPFDSGTWHKVKTIKEVRERTGSGLLEAKQAVERAYPTVSRNIAVVALENLASENNKFGYGLRERIDANNHTDVLTNLATASDNVPF